MEAIAPDRAAALVERHLQLFNEPDRVKREQAMPEVYTADLLFTDPHYRSVGYQGYCDAADAVHARFPGFTIRDHDGMDVHHDLARFGWTLNAPETPPLQGIDVIRFRDDLIAEIAIFIDSPFA